MTLFGQVESQARQLLARASVLAEAKAATLSSGPGKNAEAQFGPSGNSADLYTFLVVRFKRCTTAEDFEAFCDLARHEIDGVCKSKPALVLKEETQPERCARMIKQGHNASARWVAVNFYCSESEVRRVRKDAGLDPETGKRRAPVPDDLTVRRQLVFARARSGLSIRQIEDSTGEARSTIQRWLAA